MTKAGVFGWGKISVTPPSAGDGRRIVMSKSLAKRDLQLNGNGLHIMWSSIVPRDLSSFPVPLSLFLMRSDVSACEHA